MSDAVTLRGRIWPPAPGSSATCILYLHGIQSHGGWFEWSASLLAQGGAGVILPDRRGSGLNTYAPGDCPGADRLLADIDEIVAWARNRWSARRIALVGVSWGGKLAVAWALRQPSALSSLLLVAPGLFPQVDVVWWQRGVIAASRVLWPTRRFAIPLDDPRLFTDSPAGQAFITADALKLTRATARFLVASAALDWRIRRAPAGSIACPLTAFLAARDRIVCNKRTEAWVRKAARATPDVVGFDAAHTLEFEDDADAFAQALLRWRDELPAHAP